MIFGRPGSGKSTFSLWFHKKTGLPLHHLDKHFFVENWTKRDTEEFLKAQKTIVSQPQWIIDGNCLRSLEIRYERADLCLYFLYPRSLCLWRAFKRLWDKSPEIDDRAPGCYEKLRLDLLHYLWIFEEKARGFLDPLRKKHPKTPLIIIRNDRELEGVRLLLAKHFKAPGA